MSKKLSRQTDTASLRRLAPPLAFVLALCLLVICCYDSGYTSLPPTEKRYSTAKANIASLKTDIKKANQRESWEKLAQEFRDIYDADPHWPNRPAALFRAAESLEELAGRSFTKADARKAITCYETLALRHAESRLADDALFRAARIRAAWLKDDKGALEILVRAKKQYPNGDMIPQIMALEKALRASARGRTAPEASRLIVSERSEPREEPPAAQTKHTLSESDRLQSRYQAAKKRMEDLADDTLKSCWRQPWEELRNEFLTISQKKKDWNIAPGALFRAAVCQQRLARCSHLGEDYRVALQLYQRLPKEFPQSVLADDSLLQAARISAHLNQRMKALALLEDLEKQYPQGDMLAQAKIYKESLREKPVSTKSQAAPATLKSELQVLSWASPSKNSVEIVLEMSGPVVYKAYQKKNERGRPSIVVDLKDASIVRDIRKGVNVNGSLLQAVRVRNGKEGSASLHFDFRDVGKFVTRLENDPYRIVLQVAAGDSPLPQRQNAVTLAEVGDTKKPAKAKPVPPARKVRATDLKDMASQLGLNVQTVFIDAGHGGRDPGTVHNNVLERTITLDVAMTLGRLLRANGLDVIYSRKDNKAVSLSERTHMANRARADLFISIHVNACEDTRIHGFETYYLDFARNPQAARVAALENAGSDRRLGDMQDMLADVMLTAKVDESRRLAKDIQRLSMFRLKKRNYTVKNNGVKSAPFHVLIGAQMPAVLVELGYCSNKTEARRLSDAKYRLALAEGLAEGILAYRDYLLRLRTAQNTLTPTGPDAI